MGPVGLAGTVTEDALDEAGGTGFALVAGVAGVAQVGVEQRVVAHVNVSVGHIFGAAASRWHWMGVKKKTDGGHNREIKHPLAPAHCADWYPRGSNPAWEVGIRGMGVTPGLGEINPVCKKTLVTRLCLCTGDGEGEMSISSIFAVTCSSFSSQ